MATPNQPCATGSIVGEAGVGCAFAQARSDFTVHDFPYPITETSEINMPQTPTAASSSPSIPEPRGMGNFGWDSDLDDDESSWSEEDPGDDWDDKQEMDDADSDAREINPTEQTEGVHDSNSRRPSYFRSQRAGAEQDQKNNLFDWSEKQPFPRGLDDRPPPRPKTVHGKKNPGGRGSRSAGRRAPSGLHARSQSVPVLADLGGSRTPMTSKFGTWGVGGKGVTEDWNEDFDFDVLPSSQMHSVAAGDSHNNSSTNTTMVVPDAIKAQQTNVLANIGLLKEWGLLIEELKELRERATSLGLGMDQHADLFDEVDAMVDLADLEADDEGLPTYRTPGQSPAVNFDGSEVNKLSPILRATRFDGQDDDVFGPLQSKPAPKMSPVPQTPDRDADLPNTRPRKNSEAVAQSVIRAVQARGKDKRKGFSEPPSTPSKKVPFDTTTLRHIVPYVNGLSKKMKQILRNAEGLQSSPKQRRRSPDHVLRQAFIEPEQEDAQADSSLRRTAAAGELDAERVLIAQMTSTKMHE